MKTTTIRKFREEVSQLLQGKEPIMVTRHGKPAGVLYPLTDPQNVPMEVRRQLFLEFSQRLARELDARGITEEDIQRDFAESKKRRRRR